MKDHPKWQQAIEICAEIPGGPYSIEVVERVVRKLEEHEAAKKTVAVEDEERAIGIVAFGSDGQREEPVWDSRTGALRLMPLEKPEWTGFDGTDGTKHIHGVLKENYPELDVYVGEWTLALNGPRAIIEDFVNKDELASYLSAAIQSGPKIETLDQSTCVTWIFF